MNEQTNERAKECMNKYMNERLGLQTTFVSTQVKLGYNNNKPPIGWEDEMK